MIGDFLYQLTPRDIAGNAHVPVNRTIDIVSNANLIDGVLFTVPFDQVLVVTAFAVNALADAAFVPQLTRLFTQNPSAAQSCDLWSDYWGSVPALNYRSSSRCTPGMVYLPPGWLLSAQAGFTGAGANNRLFASFLGYLLPRGNLSLP